MALGAEYIEKHFTLDNNMDGPDHKASANVNELKEYIDKIRKTEVMLGTGIKKCMDCELDNREIVRRSIALNKDMKEGQIINENDIIGKKLKKNRGIYNFTIQ